MAKNLLIVESPAKAKTINKYLGKDFTVLASYGHVRDLVPKEGAVDPDAGFAMRYDVIEKNEKHVDAIAKAAKGAEHLFLATDPDREGEAISWHIAEILQGARPAQGPHAAARGVHRDHPARDQGSDEPPARHRQRPGRRAAGAPRARLPGRLQPVAGAVAQGPARPVRRPRAVAGAAHDRRARGGDRSLHRPRILVDRSRVPAPVAGVHRAPDQLDGKKFEQFTITDGDTAEAARKRIVAAANGALQVTDVTSKERKRPRLHRSPPRRCSRRPRAS